jgi:hypothetical protein
MNHRPFEHGNLKKGLSARSNNGTVQGCKAKLESHLVAFRYHKKVNFDLGKAILS